MSKRTKDVLSCSLGIMKKILTAKKHVVYYTKHHCKREFLFQVFHLLTKILKTEDQDEIKDWLMQAPLKGK